MSYLLLVLFLVILCFSFVIFFGAPYLPVMSNSANQALDLLNLTEGQTILDLGSGGGKVLRVAGRKKIRAIGYELNPILCLISYLTTIRYKSNVKVICGNFWSKELPDADAVFVFLLPKYMKKLDGKLKRMKLSHDLKLVSFAFEIPGKKPYFKKDNLFFYLYR